MPISDGLISARQLCSNSVDTRNIAPGAVTPTEVLTGFNFVELVTVLPTTGNFEGRIVYLTTDNKLYRHDGSAFLLAVDGADITAATISGDRLIANTITAGEIQAGAIGASELAAINIEVGKFIRSTTFVSGSSGWSIDADGSAEFDNVIVRGTIQASSIEGNVTLGTGGVVRTATSGQRIELSEADNDQLNLYSGDSFEAVPGFLRSAISGAGATRTLQVNLRAASTTGDTNAVQMVVRTESFDDSSSRPGVVFSYAGGSSQDPLFALQNDFDLRIGGTGLLEIDGLGSASNPAIGIGTSFDDGIYSPADSQLSVTIAGVEAARWIAGQSLATLGTTADPAWSFISDDDTGLYRSSSGRIAFTSNNKFVGLFGTQGLEVIAGTATLPSMTFQPDSNTGIFRASENFIGFAGAGTTTMTVGWTGSRTDINVNTMATGTDSIMHYNPTTDLVTYDSSSRKIKKNISPFTEVGLTDRLVPSQFKYRGKITTNDPMRWRIGLIAEDTVAIDERFGPDSGDENYNDRAILAAIILDLQDTRRRLTVLEAA